MNTTQPDDKVLFIPAPTSSNEKQTADEKPAQNNEQPPSTLAYRFMHGSIISPMQQASIKRILVCQLRQIGDVLLTTPAIAMLAKQFPQAEIHFFTEKKCAPMLHNNPHIHTIWELDKKKLPTLFHELAYYKKVAQTVFDLTIAFQILPRIRWVVGFSKAPFRLAPPPPWYLRWMFTHWTQPNNAYAAAFKAATLAPLGLTWDGEKPELYLSAEEKSAASEMLQQWGITPKQTPFITLDVTHRRKTRRWSNEHYAALIDNLAAQFPSMHFLLPYGPGEQKEIEELRSLCVHKSQVIIPSFMISLRQLAACMQHATLHIGNCSAPRHIAVAVGLPTLTILGATSTGWTFPSEDHIHVQLNLPCQPCNKNTCDKNYACLEQLSADYVAKLASEHLQKKLRG